MIAKLIRQQRRVLWFIVVAAFLLRITLVIALHTYRLPSEQDHFLFAYETGRVARSLAEGRGVASPFPMPSGATALLPPGYPLLLAGIFKVFGIYTAASAAAALTLNCLFAALTCLPVFALGKAIFSPAAGLIAAALLAIYPPSVWHSVHTIWDTNLFTLGLALCVWATYRATRSMRVREWALAGALAAVTSLVNPAGLSFFGLALAWAAFRDRRPPGRALAGPAAAAAIAALVLLPWIARNYVVFGEPVLRSGLALELKLGNESVWNYAHPSFSKAEFTRYERLSEPRYMDACWAEAVRVIASDPGCYASAVAKRAARFWTGLFIPDKLNFDQRPLWRRLAMDLLNLVTLSLGLAGLALAIRRGRPAGLLAILFAAFPAVYYFTRVCERYRFPMDPYLLLFCSFALYCGLEARFSRPDAAARNQNAQAPGGSRMLSLSIVIPAYDEEMRLPGALETIGRFIESRTWKFVEVIVVDDGSTDATASIVRKAARRRSYIRLLRNDGNRGKGYSVRHGMTSATGRWVLFTDADLSSPIEEVDRLIAAAREHGAEVAIGSRALDPSLITAPQSALRRLAGRTFNVVTGMLTGLRFADTQCGFKLFQAHAAARIFERQRIDGFGFDVESLFIARHLGFRTVEVPVRWAHSEGTKVKMFRDSLKMFLDVLRVRWYKARGYYAAGESSATGRAAA